jgi:hypothetical protein
MNTLDPRAHMERLLIGWSERTPLMVRGFLGLWVVLGLVASSIPEVRRMSPTIRIILNAPLLAFILLFALYMVLRKLYWLSWPVRKAWAVWTKRKAG